MDLTLSLGSGLAQSIRAGYQAEYRAGYQAGYRAIADEASLVRSVVSCSHPRSLAHHALRLLPLTSHVPLHHGSPYLGPPC